MLDLCPCLVCASDHVFVICQICHWSYLEPHLPLGTKVNTFASANLTRAKALVPHAFGARLALCAALSINNTKPSLWQRLSLFSISIMTFQPVTVGCSLMMLISRWLQWCLFGYVFIYLLCSTSLIWGPGPANTNWT